MNGEIKRVLPSKFPELLAEIPNVSKELYIRGLLVERFGKIERA